MARSPGRTHSAGPAQPDLIQVDARIVHDGSDAGTDLALGDIRETGMERLMGKACVAAGFSVASRRFDAASSLAESGAEQRTAAGPARGI